MPRRIIEEKIIPTGTVKKMLEEMKREMNQFQIRTLEYTTHFSKINPQSLSNLEEKLLKECQLEVADAVQIINCAPETVEELRVFLPRSRVPDNAKLKEIINILNQHRI